MYKAVFKKALRDSLPVLMGYVTMGFAAGVLLVAKGGLPCPVFWGVVTAALFISGTLQFVIVDWFTSHATILSVALLTLAINFRYAMYGVSMLGRWKNVPLLKKCFLIHTLTDETYALEVACRLEPPAAHLAYCVILSALNLSYWVTGVAAGAATGSALPIPSEGIEYAMTALFLVILTDQVRTFLEERRRGR
ncbi:MAG: AzlC family ABC transporter permease [Kiritimatiellae bacterium]|nr:AzlC family ABC transporter permease [Kiritimatiellia bacterium]